MKRVIGLFTMCLMFLFAIIAHADSSFLSEYEKDPLPKLKVPNVKTNVLKNGVRCFLMEDHTLPIVKIAIAIRVGRIYDPSDKVGLAALVGMTMRSGGTADLTPFEFDTAVDSLGANLSSAIGSEMGTASLKVLSEDLEENLSLLIDMVFKPRFDEKRFNVSRHKLAEALRRERDDPPSYASRLYRQLVYGENSPWARIPKMEKLPEITVDDARAFHKKYFKTNNMMIAAAGDFDSGKLLRLIEHLTENAPKGDIVFPMVKQVDVSFKPEVRKMDMPLTQAYIRMGHLGVRRHNPDWFSIYVMGYILGASNFKSRLMEDIRTKRGMAYSISGGVSQGTDRGLFVVNLSTSLENESKAIELVREHIMRLWKDGDITDDELEFAKSSMLSGMIFEIDSPYKVVTSRIRFHFYDYPDDYWLVAYDGVEAVSKEDINRVARKYLHPDSLKVLMLGPEGKAKK